MNLTLVLATTLEAFRDSLRTASHADLIEARTHMAYTRVNHGSAFVVKQLTARIDMIDAEIASLDMTDAAPVDTRFAISA
jgi:hypothetical protein